MFKLISLAALAAMLFVGVVSATTDEEVDQALIDLTKGGSMATLSTNYMGTPFGTPVPYALDGEGRAIIFLSDLAVHTKNLKKNSNCSIMVLKEDKDDPFNSARVTFVGKIVKVGDKEREAYKKMFLAKQPTAKDFADFGDFNYYYIEIDRVFYVGGFGDIQWIKSADYKKAFKTKKV